jgi:hypothetical protein
MNRAIVFSQVRMPDIATGPEYVPSKDTLGNTLVAALGVGAGEALATTLAAGTEAPVGGAATC